MTFVLRPGSHHRPGRQREYLTGPEKHVVKLRFRNAEELIKGDFAEFLKEHLGQL
jgi:hypothetical protein